MSYLYHPSELQQETCSHCLAFVPCVRVAIAESPSISWASKDFDLDAPIRVSEILLCVSCHDEMSREQSERPYQWYRPERPGGLTVVADALDAEVIG